MTQEKDLCARLPYSVKCYYEADGGKAPVHTITIGLFAEVANRDDVVCKPYLRPLSSMTEEEVKDLSYRILQQPDLEAVRNLKWFIIEFADLGKLFDWLNSHHFDYRGLIEKGLALEAPKDMYKTE